MEASQSADKWGIAIPLARTMAQRGSKPADQGALAPITATGGWPSSRWSPHEDA
ncbi:hypothetical protein J3F84DRAFT_367054 [Trichoderma pleuroticola]